MIFDKAVRRIFASTETQHNLTLDDPTGWTTGGTLYTGRASQAMKLSAVNACVECITDSIAKMPVFLMHGDTRERIRGHPALRLLTERPNEAMTPAVYGKLVEARRLLEGNSYVLIRRNGWGEPIELLPIAPGYMVPYLHDDGQLWYVGTNPKTGEYRKFWPEDILHYKAFSSDGLTGISVLKRAAQTISAALAAQGYEESFYRNGAQLSGVLQTDTDLSQRQIDADGKELPSLKNKIRAEWARIHAGADNAYRIAVLDNGLKYTPISANNRDAQFIESKVASVEDIARFFGVPLYKLNAGKQSYSSNEQNAIEYIVSTLHPIVTQYEQEDTYRLLLPRERAAGLEFRRNMMGELRGDWNTRGTWYRQMREIGVFSVDDICALEDMPDVPGGNTRQASLNYVPLEDWPDLSRNRNAAKGGNNL